MYLYNIFTACKADNSLMFVLTVFVQIILIVLMRDFNTCIYHFIFQTFIRNWFILYKVCYAINMLWAFCYAMEWQKIFLVTLCITESLLALVTKINWIPDPGWNCIIENMPDIEYLIGAVTIILYPVSDLPIVHVSIL